MDSNGSDSLLLTYPQLQNLLRIEFARARRYGYPMSILVMQIDRLDHLRDLYGVGVKRDILNRVVQVVQGFTRLSDAIGVHSDRVTILLPHTDVTGAQVIAQRLVDRINELQFEIQGRGLAISVSVGVAHTGEGAPIFYDALLKQANQALQDASQTGGNQIQLFHIPAGDHTPA